MKASVAGDDRGTVTSAVSPLATPPSLDCSSPPPGSPTCEITVVQPSVFFGIVTYTAAAHEGLVFGGCAIASGSSFSGGCDDLQSLQCGIATSIAGLAQVTATFNLQVEDPTLGINTTGDGQGAVGPQGPQGRQGPPGRATCRVQQRGKRVRVTCRVQVAKRSNLSWRLMRGGKARAKGSATTNNNGNARISLNATKLSKGSYVLRVKGQKNGTRIVVR